MAFVPLRYGLWCTWLVDNEAKRGLTGDEVIRTLLEELQRQARRGGGSSGGNESGNEESGDEDDAAAAGSSSGSSGGSGGEGGIELQEAECIVSVEKQTQRNAENGLLVMVKRLWMAKALIGTKLRAKVEGTSVLLQVWEAKAGKNTPAGKRQLANDELLFEQEFKTPKSNSAASGGSSATQIVAVGPSGQVQLLLKPVKADGKPVSAMPKTLEVGSQYEWEIRLRNEGRESLKLNDVNFIRSKEFFVTTSLTRAGVELVSATAGSSSAPVRAAQRSRGSVQSKSSSEHRLSIQFQAERSGVFQLSLLFRFQTGNVSYLLGPFTVSNAKELDLLESNGRWEESASMRRFYRRSSSRIVAAQPPMQLLSPGAAARWVRRVGDYPVPDFVQQDVGRTGHADGQPAWQLKENYQQRLHHLMFVEEASVRVSMRDYDIAEARFETLDYVKMRSGEIMQMDGGRKFAKLVVPGLADARPSVLYNDCVYVSLADNPDSDVEYEGWVYRSERDHLVLVFCPEFFETVCVASSQTGETPKFYVRFQPDRLHYRLVHRGIDDVDPNFVWPTSRRALPIRVEAPRAEDFPWFDSALNADQRSAVLSVIRQPLGVPFLLFGPFGTGKSRTLVEMVKQACLNVTVNGSASRVLVVAPSNSIADMLCSMLSPQFGTDRMLRLNSFNRSLFSVKPAEVQDYSCYDDRIGIFDIPDLNRLLRYDVVIATAASSALLSSVGVLPGHFSHIMVDEASQLMEAELLVPLSLASDATVVVMAGDDKQFGPVVHAQSTRLQRMHHSLMERLARTCADVYGARRGKQGEWGSISDKFSQVAMHLRVNYRVKDPELLAIQSKMFYGGMLAKAPSTEGSKFASWKKLSNQAFPLLVVGVEGEDLQESDSPSFFNRYEAIEIGGLVQNMLQQYGSGMTPRDIGIISPYVKQCEKIRTVLSSRQIRGVKVGTPREFEGHERPVIFVSTVRSLWRRYDVHDRKYHVGAVRDARQMCSMLSRATSLVVLVCDPYNLVRDERWKHLIDTAIQKRNYAGPELNTEYLQKRAILDGTEPGSEEMDDQDLDTLLLPAAQYSRTDTTEFRSRVDSLPLSGRSDQVRTPELTPAPVPAPLPAAAPAPLTLNLDSTNQLVPDAFDAPLTAALRDRSRDALPLQDVFQAPMSLPPQNLLEEVLQIQPPDRIPVAACVTQDDVFRLRLSLFAYKLRFIREPVQLDAATGIKTIEFELRDGGMWFDAQFTQSKAVFAVPQPFVGWQQDPVYLVRLTFTPTQFNTDELMIELSDMVFSVSAPLRSKVGGAPRTSMSRVASAQEFTPLGPAVAASAPMSRLPSNPPGLSSQAGPTVPTLGLASSANESSRPSQSRFFPIANNSASPWTLDMNGDLW